MIAESFPAEVDFQTEHTRPEFQGAALSCTTFGATSALEAMAARVGQIQQLSPRFLWFYADKAKLSVETIVATVNRVGICRDELCPYVASLEAPYDVKDIDVMPDTAAWMDAQRTSIKMSVKRVSSKEDVMRSLATGYTLISIRVNPSGSEHCEAIIGYDIDKGMKIHGSGASIYWEPWESIPLTITQLWAITSCPWSPVPHPDYVEGDLPTFANGVLTLPLLDVVMPYPQPWMHFCDVRVVFDSFGEISVNDMDISGSLPRWSTTRNSLSLPTVIYGGQRYTNISLTRPALKVLHYEAVP